MHTRRPLCLLCWLTALSVLAGICAASAARGDEAVSQPSDEGKLLEGLDIVALQAFPEMIQLEHRMDYRQLVLLVRLASGEVVDVTRLAQLTSPAQFAEISSRGIVRPLHDGVEELQFTFGTHTIAVPVHVQGASVQREVSFLRDVQPAFSKMSCNAGTCHGSKDGKNGFKLSLRGYDPLFDHRALTDDIGARRFNRAAPDQSLILLKASGTIAHVGGVRTEVGSPYYELVRAWIASGARLDLDAPRVSAIEIFPQNPVLPRAGLKQQMVVQATYTDGTVRDVTREAFIESGNIETVQADENGLLRLLRQGEGAVLARYEGAYAATTLTVMGDRTGFTWEQPPTFNYIDELVYDKLQRVKIQPSELCADEEFVRRIYLDIIGIPPTAEEVRDFLSDQRPSRAKRDALVDQLVGSPEYVAFWTNKWADLLLVNRKFLGEEGAMRLRNWIEQAVASNMPYDQFAYEILTASGSTFDNPAAAYYKTLRDPADIMENTTQLFLAVRFNCNKCHDHPFERWTQDQYYQMAAYFGQVGRKEDPSFAGQKIGGTAVEGATPLVEIIYDASQGEVKHDRTGQVAAPRFPYRHADVSAADTSRREQLARWVTSPQNQYFARSFVNRLWGYLFGVGIIEPIDDIRAGNPPSNPELLEALERDFVNHGFDIQHMFRTICKSRAYQHSVKTNRWNEWDEINYSHAIPRRLPAEVLYDAIHIATGSQPNLPGVPAGFRAAQLPDAGIPVPFLDDFGRPVRESACECERSDSMVLGPIMKLVNGPTVSEAITDSKNALTRLVAEQTDDRKLIEEVFLRFLARYPTADELQLSLQAVESVGQDYEMHREALQSYKQALPAKQAEWEQRQQGASDVPPEIAAIFAVDPAERTAEQQTALTSHFRSLDEELARLEAAERRAAEERDNRRLVGIQDLAWALINNPSFLFNR